MFTTPTLTIEPHKVLHEEKLYQQVFYYIHIEQVLLLLKY